MAAEIWGVRSSPSLSSSSSEEEELSSESSEESEFEDSGERGVRRWWKEGRGG